ncbi:MarR family winged helix-turn-helix transcriptional regulator [Sinomicrobium weinanense]|uniref:MarR family transcriptional regulator n=1 Tax=Sinomicrobium weinanense TaxID=2842200 RepID=A0A926Q3Y8_9FLAO|nr:MarR family transcriptional regulator [Sinomicrobium weinanense]MBC9796511.1 MarR family transcriptional regulator [Sinomicrobium weinanense]MBU3123527.1 MarR family transcriptional regulator [Sinomicrobium weinanense]
MRIEDIIKTEKMHSHSRTIINLMYTANEISSKTSEAIKPYDISLPQFNVLRILKGQKGNPANLQTIQERMVARTSNTTRIVDKLIDKGLVKRIQCPQNRRKVEIFITESGLELVDKVSVAVTRIEKQIIKDLSEKELETFNHTLDTLRS